MHWYRFYIRVYAQLLIKIQKSPSNPVEQETFVGCKGSHLPISLLHLIKNCPDVSEFTIKECL